MLIFNFHYLSLPQFSLIQKSIIDEATLFALHSATHSSNSLLAVSTVSSTCVLTDWGASTSVSTKTSGFSLNTDGSFGTGLIGELTWYDPNGFA